MNLIVKCYRFLFICNEVKKFLTDQEKKLYWYRIGIGKGRWTTHYCCIGIGHEKVVSSHSYWLYCRFVSS